MGQRTSSTSVTIGTVGVTGPPCWPWPLLAATLDTPPSNAGERGREREREGEGERGRERERSKF